jgi:hypothetical protein
VHAAFTQCCGRDGAAILEEVLEDVAPPPGAASAARHLIPVPPVPRYGPPPGSFPVPRRMAGRDDSTTSRQVRSLLVGHLADHPSVDGQALQLALGELSQAMDRAQVRFGCVEAYSYRICSLGLLISLFKHAVGVPTRLQIVVSFAKSWGGVFYFFSRFFRCLLEDNSSSGVGGSPPIPIRRLSLTWPGRVMQRMPARWSLPRGPALLFHLASSLPLAVLSCGRIFLVISEGALLPLLALSLAVRLRTPFS